jgi:predicted  nucleic acid-binding Zn-ribbon protein
MSVEELRKHIHHYLGEYHKLKHEVNADKTKKEALIHELRKIEAEIGKDETKMVHLKNELLRIRHILR